VKENDVILEINSSPSRFDLDDEMAYQALKTKVKLTINTDSHHSDQLRYMNYGVHIARRAWAEPEDIINTYSIKKLKELFEVN
jgi:DNA polymerase (family 10)